MQLFYNPKKGATIFDIVLNTYCTINLITKFALDNAIYSFDYVASGNEQFVYNSELIAKEHISNEILVNNYNFTTGNLNIPNASFNDDYLLTENEEIISTEDNNLIKYE